MRTQSQASQRWIRARAGSSSNIEELSFEIADDALPGEALGLRPRREAEAPGERQVADDSLRRAHEGRLVVHRHEERRALALEMLARRGVVVGDDAEAARHGLERDVAESLRG